MKAQQSFETSATNYQSTLGNAPEELSLPKYILLENVTERPGLNLFVSA
jgi:hypothetical protein